MSHFTVVVIGDNYEGQLDPYSENIEVDEYLDSVVTDEQKEFFTEHYVKIYPKDSDLSFDALYKKHGKDWNGNKWKKNEDGVYCSYSTYNPDSKWDWYSVGGRWSGYFRLKEGREGTIGVPGAFNNVANENTADMALKCDIDFSAMRKEAEDKAAKTYDNVYAVISGTPVNESWDSVRARFDDVDKARAFYHKQERVAAFDKIDGTGFFDSVENYNIDRDTYIKNAGDSAISPYAIVKDGEWYQKGDMGWWGMSSNDMEQTEWNKKVVELFDSVPDDTLFTLVDCHI